jgi:hypothetical protein
MRSSDEIADADSTQSFYQNRIGKKDERPPMDFLVEKTSKVSPTIANTSAVNADLVSLWAKQWKKSGFF